MVVENVELPKITDYYVAEKDVEDLRNILIGKEIKFKDKVNFTISVDYNDKLYSFTRTILDKTKLVLIGGRMQYEYELDIGSNNRAHIFKITADGEEINCIISSMWYGDNIIKINASVVLK